MYHTSVWFGFSLYAFWWRFCFKIHSIDYTFYFFSIYNTTKRHAPCWIRYHHYLLNRIISFLRFGIDFSSIYILYYNMLLYVRVSGHWGTEKGQKNLCQSHPSIRPAIPIRILFFSFSFFLFWLEDCVHSLADSI